MCYRYFTLAVKIDPPPCWKFQFSIVLYSPLIQSGGGWCMDNFIVWNRALQGRRGGGSYFDKEVEMKYKIIIETMGRLQLAVTWYKIRHAGEQAMHWDIQNKENVNLS